MWAACGGAAGPRRLAHLLLPLNKQQIRLISRLKLRQLELRLQTLEQGQEGAPQPLPGPDKAHNDQKSDQRSEALATLRSHNTSLPSLQGQPIKGQVVQVDKHSVTIDTGFKTNAKFYKRGLQLSQLVSSTDKSVRESQHDFRIGDVLQFVINEVETPYGEVWLDIDKPAPGHKFQQVWQELQRLRSEGREVLGRVLNPVNGGYSVGLGGIVAFCPLSQCSVLTASKVGVLQPFHIYQMTEANHNVVVVDPKMMAPGSRPVGT